MNKSIPWRRIITRIALALLTVVVALVLALQQCSSSDSASPWSQGQSPVRRD